MRLLTIMILALGSVSLSAQSLSEAEKADIKNRLEDYFELTKANEFSLMMDYVYPKLFTLATREQMVEVFSSLETMGLGLNVDEITLKDGVEYLTEEEGRKYAVANYDIKIRLELKSATMQSDQVIESLKSAFQVSYNATDMNYDEETKMLSFSGNKYTLAVKDPEHDGDNWYFLEYDPSNPMAAQMLLSSEVLDQFKAKMGQ